MRFASLSAILMLTSCSAASDTNTSHGTNSASPHVQKLSDEPASTVTPSGKYLVNLNPDVAAQSLPTNADLKMLDGDLTRYAVKLCGLDFANKAPAERCAIFVQPDKASLLTGYVVLQQGGDVRISTALETDTAKTGLGCFIDGILENNDSEHPGAPLNMGKDFEARLPFVAWEKSPGDWVVSSGEDDGQGAAGIWYVKRNNDKLRVTQERWNYCYRDGSAYIDEVFKHVVTLTRQGASLGRS
jgi:hypothetical protein